MPTLAARLGAVRGPTRRAGLSSGGVSDPRESRRVRPRDVGPCRSVAQAQRYQFDRLYGDEPADQRALSSSCEAK